MKNETLGDRLRRLRNAQNLTIEEVARRLEVSSSTYREWENGRSIRGEPYIKIRDLFKITLEELMTGTKGDCKGILEEVDALESHIKIIRNELLRLA